MKKQEDFCATIFPWLRANLGKNCCALLTGTDTKALKAAVQIIGLYNADGDISLIGAFRAVVCRMQPSSRHLAYHAIAHVMHWPDRQRIWDEANLQSMPRGRCKYEPN